MSKHNKFDKFNRDKYQYTKNEFIKVICNKCGLCKSTVNPEFCYESVYKDNPKKTIKVILEQLIEMRNWLINSGYTINTCPDEHIRYILQTIFCASDFCGQLPKDDHQCKNIDGCLYAFRHQIKNTNANNLIIFNNKCNKILDFNKFKTKQKKKIKKIVHLPTFFCNSSFKKEIGEILDGDNP
jgi:hypothetical protein